MSESKPPAINTHVAARTAEALALPHRVCRRRDCRRRSRCVWSFRATGEPCCLRNLTAEQRWIFDEVYRTAHFAKGFLGSDPQHFEAREGRQRALDDLAIAIARTSPDRWNSPAWDAARRARERRMAQFDEDKGQGDG